MDFNEEKRNVILELIEDDNVKDLKNYTVKNNICLKDFNENFDLLIYGIENGISLEFINFLIHQCQYENLNYSFFINENNRNLFRLITYKYYKVPLFSAVALSNFEIADLLIDNKADINFVVNFKNNDVTVESNKINILQYLSYIDYLDKKNLKYILKKGIHYNKINQNLLNNWITSRHKNELLEVLFKYYIFDNSFILSLLNLYKNQNSLSYEQFQEIIINEKSKIEITDSMYANVMKRWYEKIKVIELFLNYDSRKSSLILNDIYKYDILDKAVCMNNIKLVQKILNLNEFDFNCVDINRIILDALKYNYTSIIIYIMERLINHQSFNYDDDNLFEIMLLKISKDNNITIMQFFINKILKNSIFNENNTFKDTSNNNDNNNNIPKYNSQYLSLILNILIKIRHLEFIKYLIENTNLIIDIKLNDKNNECPLFVAYYSIKTSIKLDYDKSQDIFRYLLTYTNLKYDDIQLLLSMAIHDKIYSVVKWLLKYNKFMNKNDDDKTDFNNKDNNDNNNDNIININSLDTVYTSSDTHINAIYHNEIDKVQLLMNKNYYKYDEKDKNDNYNYNYKYYENFTPLLGKKTI
ncbi:hypothetical protein BCR32DRAFT_247287 [Anaeromyces robustus]|uniref:Ankyrin n=1 Tax=Anaeromyces robustus TaxID=1754192 RepID=A0A1Y1WXI0_9FUNG|nr:hypothetical protein BCR32DRAFT_247287 [Anaeromyces robustus]|eukprot:ORX78279.1 hypothetical protein BCR32DRAFT_247287 [Anaeromyces robustus]